MGMVWTVATRTVSELPPIEAESNCVNLLLRKLRTCSEKRVCARECACARVRGGEQGV